MSVTATCGRSAEQHDWGHRLAQDPDTDKRAERLLTHSEPKCLWQQLYACTKSHPQGFSGNCFGLLSLYVYI